MALVFCDVSGVPVRTLTLTMPARGCWLADARLDRPAAALKGPVTLALAGLSLSGTIYRAGDLTGAGSVRIVGGAGGWGRSIVSKFYQSPAGVRLSYVLSDAASACGERVVLSSGVDRSIGFWFARRQGPASTVLGQLSLDWWVRDDGATQVGPRAEQQVASPFDVLLDGTNLAAGRVVVATDRPEDWRPGSKFVAPTLPLRQASAVVHRLTASELRTTVWTT